MEEVVPLDYEYAEATRKIITYIINKPFPKENKFQ
jgi:hypothetical protein